MVGIVDVEAVVGAFVLLVVGTEMVETVVRLVVGTVSVGADVADTVDVEVLVPPVANEAVVLSVETEVVELSLVVEVVVLSVGGIVEFLVV